MKKIPLLSSFVIRLIFSVLFLMNNAAFADPASIQSGTLREQIVAALGKQQQQNAFHFVQEKKLAILDKPLITEGELLVNNHTETKNSADCDVVWNIEKPFTMRYEVYADHIKEIDSNGERIIPTGNNPVAAALTEVMSAAFSGKWDDGKNHAKKPLADVVASGELSSWELHVTPRSNDLKKLVTAMTVAGKDGNIATVIITESNGDHTTIHLRPLH